MSQSNEFFSFEEALEELRLKEEELKRLVSEGEIRAFREGETMKLRRRDVEALRSELLGDEVVDLGEPTEELVFEDEADLADPGMATEELVSAPTLIDDLDVEDLDLEDRDVDDRDVDDRDVDDRDLSVLDVDELDGDADDRAAVAAVPTRTRAAPEPTKDAGMLALLIVNAVVFILVIPIVYGLRVGLASDFARSVAGLFTDMGQQG